MAIEMTHEIAHAAAQDAGDRSMHKAGRTCWNEDDADMACQAYHRLMPCPKGVGCALCEPETADTAGSARNVTEPVESAERFEP